MRSSTLEAEIATICHLLVSLQCGQGTLWGETLHDYRVLLRRLSVLLPLIAPHPEEACLVGQWLRHELKNSNAIRDQSVLGHYLATTSWLSALACVGDEAPVHHPEPVGLQRLISALSQWQPPGAWQLAYQLLWLQREAIVRLQEAQAPIPQLNGTKPRNRALHRLRIAVKRVRYLYQWQELVSGQPVPMLRRLTSWQQQLGQLSDLQLVRHWLRHRATKLQLRQLDAEMNSQQQSILAELGELHLLTTQALTLSLAALDSGYCFHQLNGQ